ncbi:hypothetical protein N9X43_05295, partial [Gammaproteobacteria bacterium]|nr:hypothetical protein [Gammaproteobacteria bacterium]
MRKIFLIILSLYLLYVHVIPEVFHLASGYSRLYSWDITPDLHYYTMIADLVFIFIVLTVQFIVSPKKIKIANGILPDSYRRALIYVFFTFLMLGLLAYISDLFFGGPRGYGGLDKLDANTTEQQSLSSWLGFVGLPAKFSAVAFLVFRKDMILAMGKHFAYFAALASLCMAILVVMNSISSGVRHEVVWFSAIYLVVLLCHRRSLQLKKYFKFAGLFLVFIYIGSYMGASYRMELTENKNLSFAQKVDTLSSVMSDSSEDLAFAAQLYFQFSDRLTDLDTSAALMKFYDTRGPVYLMPSFSAAVSFIPRFLWKSKPAPGSYDGSHNGLAGFVVWNVLTGSPFTNWGGYTASSHHYWEGGWPYLVIWALIFGFVSSVVFAKVSRRSGINQLGYLYVGVVLLGFYK